MNALFFVLFAIVLALIILLFCKLAALSSHYDDLTSVKTISKLLNIPRATVQRWTKQLIKRGAIQPKKQPTQE